MKIRVYCKIIVVSIFSSEHLGLSRNYLSKLEYTIKSSHQFRSFQIETWVYLDINDRNQSVLSDEFRIFLMETCVHLQIIYEKLSILSNQLRSFQTKKMQFYVFISKLFIEIRVHCQISFDLNPILHLKKKSILHLLQSVCNIQLSKLENRVCVSNYDDSH